MSLYKVSLINELTKMFKKKKFYVLLIIEIIICLGSGIIGFLIGRVDELTLSSKLMFSNMPMSMLGFFIQVYIPLIIFMEVSDVYNSEFQDGTIRSLFARPISRFKIFASKVSAIAIVSAIYLGALFIMTTLMKLLNGVQTSSSYGVLEGLVSYAIDLVPLLVLILMAVLIGQIIKSPSLSMLVCIIVYIGLYVVKLLAPAAGGMLFTAYLQWHTLWVGIALPVLPMLTKIMLLLSCGLIFGTAGYYLFERKEV